MMASAFITISISSTRNWAYVTCACRHGYPAGCRSTSMAITGWPVSCVSRVSNIGSSTTPLSKSRTGHAPSGSPMDGQPNVSTESWTSSRAGTVRLSRFRDWISLERRPVRVRHRYRFPPTGGPAGYLREPGAHRYSHRQARQHRNVSRPQAQHPVRRRNGEPFQHSHRGDADQAYDGTSFD